MLTGVVLSDGDVLVCVLQYRAAVVVYVKVIGRREDGDDRGEFFRWCLAVHGISDMNMSAHTIQ